ncbi:hypothetical protein IKG45_03865 [Candidatus Saccharibacteria bacterium]|nr:hypothetical protein [Candidatus Saccharibacteria bacterium]
MLKNIFKIGNLKYVVAFLLPLVIILLYRRTLDNDTWFVLAEGRHILEKGIYYNDVLSMHDGLEIVVQQYGFAVIFWLIYSVFGSIGLYVMTILFNFLICFLVYKIAMLISEKNINMSLFVVVLTDVFLSFIFIVTRAQVLSYVFILLTMYLLELYVKKKEKKYLYPIPLVSLLQINIHASLWPMIILILGVYIVDSFKIPKLHLQGYKTRPLIITLIISALIAFINPYGVKMLTFIFTSYGVNEIFELVSEMAPFDLRSLYNILVYGAIVTVILAYIFGKKKNIRVRYLLLFFGFLALSLNSVKGFSELFLVMFIPMALLFKDFQIKSKKVILFSKAAIMWSFVIVFGAVGICGCLVLSRLSDAPSEVMKEAVDAIDDKIGDREKSNLRIYTGYNDGGYLEFRGYKPYLDPRAEVFIKKNNGKEDILQEWIDFEKRLIEKNDFIDKYDFDYLFVSRKSDPAYELDEKKYDKIYEDEEAEVRVYERLENK